ncbi:MAG: hypothetical protein KAG43_01460 [Candidatus Marithrix sp.]|nr:hypothetical protein [Candidatus Marithrix sp.]
MNTAIRIDNELYTEAKQIGQNECRTVDKQIIFWAQLGKTALENPDLPIEFIAKILISKKQDRALAEPFLPLNKND